MTIAAILLAAGGSTRMGPPKQLLKYQGQSLVRRSALAALASLCRPVQVVVGCHADRVRQELNGLPVQIVDNDNWAMGMGSSIRAGLQAALDRTPHLDAAVFMVCDQPHVNASAIGRLLNAYQQTRAPVVASAYQNTTAVPALFGRSLFPDLLALPADQGAKAVIMTHAERVVSVSLPEGAMDVDTVSDYERLQRATESSFVSRREFVGTILVGGAVIGAPSAEAQTEVVPPPARCVLTINGQSHDLKLDTRTT